MEFWLAIADLVRRWRVMLAVVLVASCSTIAVFLAVPVTYVSSATMVLTTTEHGGTESQDPSVPGELTNPMLNFSESLATTADMLIWSMSSRDVEESLSDGGSTKVLVNDGRTNPDLFGFNGPIIYITAESTDPHRSVAGVHEASDMVRSRLEEWQRAMDAPRSTYVTMVDVVAPTAAVPRMGSHIRLAATAGMGGFVVSLAVAYLAMRTRERRKAAERTTTSLASRPRRAPASPASTPTTPTPPTPVAAPASPASRAGVTARMRPRVRDKDTAAAPLTEKWRRRLAGDSRPEGRDEKKRPVAVRGME